MSQLRSLGSKDVQKSIDNYNDKFEAGNLVGSKEHCEEFVNDYYDIATDFYEYGWGNCFHFAPQHAGETFSEAILRHEYYLALKLSLKPGMTVLDTGCGIGGPAINMARFSECNVVGLNINKYQIGKGQKLVEQNHVEDKVKFQLGSFLEIPFDENTFEGVYSIEATCHAADQEKCYSEIFRVLKPGARFACYEWCLTDKYDANNEEHQKIKKLIELGDGLPDIRTISATLKALEKVGFKVIESEDRGKVTDHNNVAWYNTLTPGKNFRTSKIGVKSTHVLVTVMEAFRLAPKGTVKCHKTLTKAIPGLVNGGRSGVFTPAFFFLVEKPLKADDN